MRFPEDDERNLEDELAEVENGMDMMARDWPEMQERRHRLRKQIQKRQIDPLVERALQLAQNLGHTLGANEALGRKVAHLERRIEVRDEELERLSDRDALLARAEAAEATIARSKKRKSRR